MVMDFTHTSDLDTPKTSTAVIVHPVDGRAIAPSEMIADLERLVAVANNYARHSKAKNTVRTYNSNWRNFEEWCTQMGVSALPASPETVALYITAMGTEKYKVSTIVGHMSAIAKAHQMRGYESPCALKFAPVKEVLAGLSRISDCSISQKKAILIDHLRAMVSATTNTRAGARDRAILLLGFAGAFRRSEIAALRVEDLEWCEEGVKVTLRRSKTDQFGRGRVTGIPYGQHAETCPVRAIRSWLEVAGIASGPIFRRVNKSDNLVGENSITNQVIATTVKKYAVAAGLDPESVAGHSLRAGMVTQAYINGASAESIMRQTGHTSFNMVLRYIRDTNLFRKNATADAGM